MANVTIHMIAEQLGLSQGAVSQCLRNPENTRFSKKTRERVLAKARELNYIPNRLAAGLREGKTKFLSMVVPWNTPELLDTAELEAKKNGYGLSIHFTVGPDLDAERKAIQYALGQRVDGLIWMPSDTAWGYTRTISLLRQSGMRTVFLEAALPGMPEAGLVEVDYETPLQGVLQGYRKSKCEQMIYIFPERSHQMRARRVAVFEGFLKRWHISGEIVEVGDDFERITALVDRLPPSCGIICDGDWYAIHLIQCLKKKQLRIPEDVQLAVVGDMLLGGSFRLGEICEPHYSAIRRPSGEMARRAVQMLIHAVENSFSGSLPRVLLDSEWISRDTTEV